MADHIQLPQLWIKAFKNKQKEEGTYQTYYLNISNEEKYGGNTTLQPSTIGSIRIDFVGSEKNHYHNGLEKDLSKNWEIKFGKLKTLFAKKIRAGNKIIELSSEEENFLKKFMAISVSRSKFFKNKIEEKEGKFFATNDIAVLSVAINNLSLFVDYEIQFLKNTTDYNFVLPSYTLYYVCLKNFITPIVVLTPKIAIRFIPKVNCSRKHSGIVLEISDVENIKEYNHYALLCELLTNNDFLISKTKKELEILCNGD